MKKIITATLVMLSLAACKERESDPNKLPDATQTGANTGGALVDGEVWVAKKEYPNLNNGGIDATQYINENGTHTMQISMRKPLGGIYSSRISLFIWDSSVFSVNKTYKIGTNASASYSYTSSQDYLANHTEGSVTITKFDQQKQIVSGTFFFKAVDNTGKTVTITDGRFDKRFF